MWFLLWYQIFPSGLFLSAVSTCSHKRRHLFLIKSYTFMLFRNMIPSIYSFKCTCVFCPCLLLCDSVLFLLFPFYNFSFSSIGACHQQAAAHICTSAGPLDLNMKHSSDVHKRTAECTHTALKDTLIYLRKLYHTLFPHPHTHTHTRTHRPKHILKPFQHAADTY